MKVLFVSSGNSRYGVVPFIKRQGESLIKEGIILDFYLIKGKGILGYLKNIKPLRQYLKTREFDIIHAHYGLVGLLCVLSFTKKPLVLSVMGDDAYGSYNIKGKRIAKSYFEMFLTQFTIIFPKQLIVKSRNILRYIPYKRKTSIVPNGVHFDIFKPMDKEISRKDLNLPQNKKLILFLADHLDPRKNYKLFYETSIYIQDKNIKFINPYPIKHSDFAKYLNACDVFVLTSYIEGSPNVIKEAMACNCPIVSTDVGDIKEIIETTDGCFICSFKPEDIANKIQMALKFGKRTNGRNNIKYLESNAVADKIIDIYRKVLS